MRCRDAFEIQSYSRRNPQTSQAGFVFLIALCLLVLVGCAPVRPTPSTTPSETPTTTPVASGDFLVMSFNIRYGTADDGLDRWEVRRSRVMDTIRTFDPDILGVQEALAFQLDELRGAFPEYEVYGVGRDDGQSAGEHAAILFDKRRFERLDGGTFWFSDTPDEVCSRSWGNSLCRICTWVRLGERDPGRTLYVYNVHLDHLSAPSRRKSTELLMVVIARQAKSNRVIVTGDFNAGENTAEIATMRSTAVAIPSVAGATPQRLVDTFRVRHPNAVDVGTFNNWVGATTGPKIDYVFVFDSAFHIEAADIARDDYEGRFASDHFPVWARLAWIDDLGRANRRRD